MKEQELKNYLKQHFSQENEKCEWKEFKSLKHCIAGSEGDDIISYISSIANMSGGHLIIGVKDTTLDIIGIQNLHVFLLKILTFPLKIS